MTVNRDRSVLGKEIESMTRKGHDYKSGARLSALGACLGWLCACSGGGGGTVPPPASGQPVQMTTLVSDQAGAAHTDASLVNPWGLALNPTGPAWIADNHTGLATVY